MIHPGTEMRVLFLYPDVDQQPEPLGRLNAKKTLYVVAVVNQAAPGGRPWAVERRGERNGVSIRRRVKPQEVFC